MPQPKNTVFFGTPQFAANILNHLLTCQICDKNLKIVGVITQPDQPYGRKKIPSPSPVTNIATQYHLPIFKPKKLDLDNLSHLKNLKPDLFLVVAYGQIIPQNYLATPIHGTLNLHYSLLPKYRGALCLSEAIKNNEKETGVTLMLMDEKLDHGPIIAQKPLPIFPEDDIASLQTRLEPESLTLIHTSLIDYLNKNLTPTPQNDSLATYTPKTSKNTHTSAFIPWIKIKKALNGADPLTISALIRSKNPDPGAWTTIGNTIFKILSVTTKDNKLQILTVQLPGKNPITWSQFLSGHKIT